MKILVVAQYFWPENFRINDLVAALVQRGHEVTVATGLPNYPGGEFFPGYGLTKFGRWRESYAGATVLRFPLLPRGNGGGLRLALNYFSFALCASLLAPLRCRARYDAIFVYEVSPVTVAFPAIALRACGRGPVAMWVLDLWPESVAAAGDVRQRWILAAIERMVRYLYARCDRLLVQSRAFMPRLAEQGVPPERMRYLPSWAEAGLDEPAPAQAGLGHFALPQGFRIVFAGNIGVAQDFEHVLAATGKLSSHRDIHWIIAGEGRMAPWVREQIAARELGANVHMLGSHPVERMPELYAHADALLVSLKSDPAFALTIPAKIQGYLAAGRPILAMLDGEGARVVAESGGGLAGAAEDADALAANVLALYRMSAEDRRAMGRAGRVYYEREFRREALFSRLEDWLSELARRGAAGTKHTR